ncbi:hypothetical protein M0805_001455 [Coniferiporia weirii]|nr:hypothetical protein M0805_001455 [Coniferiporia weirii]
MSISWTSSDSSFNGTTPPVAGPSNTERGTRPRQGGLHSIDDFDFETLIEILGTNGADKHGENLGELETQAGKEASLQLDEPKLLSPLGSPVSLSPDKAEPADEDGNADVPPAELSAAPQSPVLVGALEPMTPISPLDLPPVDPTVPPNEQSARLPQSPGAVSQDKSNPVQRTGDDISAGSGFTRLNEELGTAVSGAREQVMDLRSRIQSLKEEIKEFAPHLYRRAFDDAGSRTDPHKKPHLPEGNGADNQDISDPRDASTGNQTTPVQDVVEGLSNEEVKSSLINICQALRIDPSTLVTLQQPMVTESSGLTPPRSLHDVIRAMRFVSDVDELVWRQTRRSSGKQTERDGDAYNIYSEENIRSLTDRVRLWEKTARSRAGR